MLSIASSDPCRDGDQETAIASMVGETVRRCGCVSVRFTPHSERVSQEFPFHVQLACWRALAEATCDLRGGLSTILRVRTT